MTGGDCETPLDSSCAPMVGSCQSQNYPHTSLNLRSLPLPSPNQQQGLWCKLRTASNSWNINFNKKPPQKNNASYSSSFRSLLFLSCQIHLLVSLDLNYINRPQIKIKIKIPIPPRKKIKKERKKKVM